MRKLCKESLCKYLLCKESLSKCEEESELWEGGREGGRRKEEGSGAQRKTEPSPRGEEK